MLDHLKANNRTWAQRKVAADAGFFRRLTGQQAPEYLWIGCSDSRVPPNEIIGLEPGELFVHRNVANLVAHTDVNCLSVLQYAVDVLQGEARHRRAAITAAAACARRCRRERRGLVDHWLRPIRDIHQQHRDELDAIPDESRAPQSAGRTQRHAQVANVATRRSCRTPGGAGRRYPFTAGSMPYPTGW